MASSCAHALLHGSPSRSPIIHLGQDGRELDGHEVCTLSPASHICTVTKWLKRTEAHATMPEREPDLLREAVDTIGI